MGLALLSSQMKGSELSPEKKKPARRPARGLGEAGNGRALPRGAAPRRLPGRSGTSCSGPAPGPSDFTCARNQQQVAVENPSEPATMTFAFPSMPRSRKTP